MEWIREPNLSYPEFRQIEIFLGFLDFRAIIKFDGSHEQ